MYVVLLLIRPDCDLFRFPGSGRGRKNRSAAVPKNKQNTHRKTTKTCDSEKTAMPPRDSPTRELTSADKEPLLSKSRMSNTKSPAPITDGKEEGCEEGWLVGKVCNMVMSA